MLRYRDVSRAAFNDSPIPAMAAALPDLDETLALEDPVDLSCRQSAHG